MTWWAMPVRGGIRGFVLAAALLALSPMPAAADELSAVFQQVLANPDDVALNMRYAELAAANGEEGRALAAYERILARDPDNAAAQRAYRRLKLRLQPAVTAFTLSTGAVYESNPRQIDSSLPQPDEDDVSFEANLKMFDERTFAGHRWRTLARAGTDQYLDLDELSNAHVSVLTGPMIELGDDTRLHVAPGAAAAWLDDDWLYVDAKMRLTLEKIRNGAVQTVYASVTHRETDPGFNGDDGLIVDLGGRFIVHDMLIEGSRFYVIPRFRYSEPGGGDPDDPFTYRPDFPGDYVEGGGRVVYYKSVAGGRAFLGGGFGAYFREYNSDIFSGPFTSTSEDRSDVLLEPSAHLIVPDVKGTKFDFRVDYRYQHNESNDPLEDFENHIVGVHTVRRF